MHYYVARPVRSLCGVAGYDKAPCLQEHPVGRGPVVRAPLQGYSSFSLLVVNISLPMETQV